MNTDGKTKVKRYLRSVIGGVLMLLVLFSFIACPDSPTTENHENNDTIPQSMPQEHIPWPSLADSPWPMYKHDPQLTGRSPYSGPSEGIADWEYSPEDGYMSHSGIVIGLENTLYFSDANGGNQDSGNLVALYNSGILKWKVNIGGFESYNTPLVRADGSIIIGSQKNGLFAISTNGMLLWHYVLNDDIIASTINIDRTGNIYFTTKSGSLYSLSSSGEIRFKNSFLGELFGFNGNIAFSPSGDEMYINTSSILFAVDTSGNDLWSYETEQGYIGSIPIVDSQGNVYFVRSNSFTQPDTLANAVVCLDHKGDIRWSFPFGGYAGIGLTIDSNGHIYFSSWSEKILYALYYNGKLKWTYGLGDSVGSGILDTEFICDANDQIYFGSSFDSYYSFTGEGSFRWLYNIPEIQFSFNPPAIDSNGMMYIISLKWPHKVFALK